MALTPGTRLGAYTIGAPLGVGGMGEVYRATDNNLGREVAVKVSLKIGPERKLFEWNVDSNREYAVGANGAFYSIDPVPDAPKQTLIHLRTNWFDEVKRLAGGR